MEEAKDRTPSLSSELTLILMASELFSESQESSGPRDPKGTAEKPLCGGQGLCSRSAPTLWLLWAEFALFGPQTRHGLCAVLGWSLLGTPFTSMVGGGSP